MTNFQWTADEQFVRDQETITIAYSRPNGDYSETVITANGQDYTCEPGTANAFGCEVTVEVAPFTPVNFSVTNGGMPDADGGGTFPAGSGGDTFFAFEGSGVVAPNIPALPANDSEVVLYYKRPDGNYAGWGLHLFPTDPAGPSWTDFPTPGEYLPAGIDETLGAYFYIRLPQDASPPYSANPDPVAEFPNVLGFIIHRGDDKDPGPDQFIRINEDGNILFVQSGINDVGTSPPAEGVVAIIGAAAHAVTRDTLIWDHGADVTSVELVISPDASVNQGTDGLEGNFEIAEMSPTANPDLPNFRHLASDPAYVLTEPTTIEETREALRGRLIAVGLDANGVVVEATNVQISGALDDVYGAAAVTADLGVNYEGGVPVLRVWAPTAQLDSGVDVKIYDDGGMLMETVAMTLDEASGVWSVTGDNTWDRMFYRYELTVYAPTVGALVTNEVTDPYSISLSANSAYSQIVNLDDADLKPPGWDLMVKPALDAPEDIVVYETHIRDFSINDPLVMPGDRGKYAAFTDPNGTGWQHLQALASAGLTHMHLLPTFDIATVNEVEAERIDLDNTVDELCAANPAAASLCPDGQTIRALLESEAGDSQVQQQVSEWMRDLDGFNWGYDPWHYSTPEGSYASDPDGTARILEFRAMVQGINDAGLRTVMDVVYNHTNASGQNQKSVLDKVVPGYYHRLDDRTGNVLRNSCCDDTAAEFGMMEKLLIESTVFWATQYKVDGFRFDLMSFHPKSTMEKLRQALDALTIANDGVDGTEVYVYGEAWNFGDIGNDARFIQSTQRNLGGTGIGSFNDRLRDAVRGGGPFDGGINHIRNQGFISGRFYDPNAENSGAAGERDDLLAKADNIRVWLAGGLEDFELVNAAGDTVTGMEIPYTNQDSGYTQDPQEAINYIGKHDNETLWDISQYKHPTGTSTADRVRAHNVGNSFILLAQGIPFVHAAQDLLRSKSIDRNSFDSGDWFNEIDWSGSDTKFRVGLPSQRESGNNWTQIQQVFDDSTTEPGAADVQAASDAFRELLMIRKSSPLFRLRTGDDIKQRLSFYNTGPSQVPGVIVMGIDGCISADVNDMNYGAILVVFNATDEAQTIALFTDETWTLHPVQAASADPVVQMATHDMNGFAVPARTTAVFVQSQGGNVCAIGAEFDTQSFVRGGFTDWGTTAPLNRVGETAVLEATVANIMAGNYEYKVASEDWSTVNCGGPEGGGAFPTPFGASTELVCGENPANLALTVAADGDVKFSLDTTMPITPTITIGSPAGTGFASDTALVRGGFNDWGNSNPTTAVGPDVLEATLNVTAGDYEFKVASDDWSTINCGGPKDGSPMPIALDTATTLSCNENPANLSISFGADGDYTFSLNKADAGNPSLTIASAAGGAFGTVSVFARGGFNDWGEADELVAMGGDVYEATVAVTTGTFEFKVASSDWATINCGTAANMPAVMPGVATTLSCGANPGNLSITFDADGNVTFSVDATNPYNPSLTVTP
ncbi:MAG: pullulanase-type alpha-1,6-glucosidase [Gammaproteobacteria bacterium]|nr:pullulanase-type alpha-1,6-glucosidase [Gammaproteobacteria bacterium]